MARFSLFREELRRAYRELRGGQVSPLRGAAAVALGLFIGTQPIFGLQTLLVIALCVWLRLDVLVAWVASNISNPFFAPALLAAEIELGAYLRTGSRPHLEHGLASSGVRAGDLFLGAPLLGLSMALIGGAVTLAALSLSRRLHPGAAPRAPYRLPEEAPAWVHAVERVAARYAAPEGATAAERTRFNLVRTALLADRVAQLIAGVGGDRAGALGHVEALRSGRGMLPLFLVELGRATSARGVDPEAESVAMGRRAAAREPRLPVELAAGDARAAPIEEADTILLIDLLHRLTAVDQEALLRRATAALRPGGRVVASVPARRYRRAREIAATLATLGLVCETRTRWRGLLSAHKVVIARLPGVIG